MVLFIRPRFLFICFIIIIFNGTTSAPQKTKTNTESIEKDHFDDYGGEHHDYDHGDHEDHEDHDTEYSVSRVSKSRRNPSIRMISIFLKQLRQFIPPMDIITFAIAFMTILAAPVAVTLIVILGLIAMVTAHPILRVIFPSLLTAIGADSTSGGNILNSISLSLSEFLGQDPSLGLAGIPNALLTSIIRTWIQAFASTLSQAALDNYQ